MKRLLHTHAALLIRRIALLYAVLMLCRVVFLLYNAALVGPVTWAEAGSLLTGALRFDTSSIVYADGAFIVLSLLPFPLRDRKWYRNLLFGYYAAVNTVLAVAVNLADCVYFRYTQKRFTADEVFFAGNENSIRLVGKFMAENWYLALVAVALTALLVWGYGRRTKPESLLPDGPLRYGADTLLLVLAVLLGIAGARGGMTRATRPITLSDATLYTPDPGKANLILSNPFCILRTAGSGGLSYVRSFPPEKLARHFTPSHRPAAPEGGRLAGRNVVVFIMESMSAEHSAFLRPDLYVGLPEKGFTPFLDSLMRSGLCFMRMYANGTRSIQAMPAVLGSIPSFKTPFVLMPQSLGRSRQLPAILAGKGYSTAFFCGSEHGSMGFGAYARSAGVERLFSREDYEKRHGRGDFDGYWGIWDEPFLQFFGEELARMPEPFFASLFTLSAHHPFVVPEQYADSLPRGYTKIHRGIAYDDMAFRRFFERYGDEEWFRRTLFVFVADHVSSEKFAAETRTYPGNMHIMGFLYTPDGELRGRIDEVTQQIDLMPTLLGLLGNDEPYFAFGRDLFNEPERPRWSVSYDGRFRALLRDEVLLTDQRTTSIERRTDSLRGTAAADGVSAPASAADSLGDAFRALIQQYYSHIERKNYLYDD